MTRAGVVAGQLASALDESDYGTARELLQHECVHCIGGRQFGDSEAIVTHCQARDGRSKHHIDHDGYESLVLRIEHRDLPDEPQTLEHCPETAGVKRGE